MNVQKSWKGSGSILIGVAIFSALINILYLTGSFYMLQVYDRVIPSRSIDTLVALSILAAILFAACGALDFFRSRVLVRASRAIDEHFRRRVFDLTSRLPLDGKSEQAGQPLRDLDNIRSFVGSGAPGVFFDLPWSPFYIAVCFLLHPWIGVLTLAGVVVMSLVTGIADFVTRSAVRKTSVEASMRSNCAESVRRNAEIVRAMGMNDHLGDRWDERSKAFLDGHQRSSDIGGAFGSFSKTLRMMIQSAALGIGAVLVIQGEATGGLIIAGSILSARAIAPIEQMIAHYKSFVNARQSWKRLREFFGAYPERKAPIALPAPRAQVSVEGLDIGPPGAAKPTVKNVSFTLNSGDAIGVIGPSASGKSTLARTLVGVWQPLEGSVRLDGASLDQWSLTSLGRHIGYLPQDVELFDGTIAENISRFDPRAADDDIINAAREANVHEMIVALPQGYQTKIGIGGAALSGGQRQRIGLARALYGDPFLLVLDEPNSNLDSPGEAALTNAVRNFRKKGGVAVLIAHRPSALAAVDQVLLLSDGEVKACGDKNQIMRPLMAPRVVTPKFAEAGE